MIDKKIKDVANIIINNLLDELILSSQSANDKNTKIYHSYDHKQSFLQDHSFSLMNYSHTHQLLSSK